MNLFLEHGAFDTWHAIESHKMTERQHSSTDPSFQAKRRLHNSHSPPPTCHPPHLRHCTSLFSNKAKSSVQFYTYFLSCKLSSISSIKIQTSTSPIIKLFLQNIKNLIEILQMHKNNIYHNWLNHTPIWL
jgi:hypothetical protein